VSTSGFLSTVTNRVDGKRRVSLPAAFRDVLADEKIRAVYCFPSLHHGAIEGMAPSGMDQLIELVEEVGRYSDEGQALADDVLGKAAKLDIDDDGRIVLPEGLMGFAGIGERATFVGLGRRFEIWSPEGLAKKPVDSALARATLAKLKLPRKAPGP